MLGRATIVKADPTRIDAGISYLRDELFPRIDALPGSRGLSLWVDRESGLVVVGGAWEDRAALEASTGQVNQWREEGARVFGAEHVRVIVNEPVVAWQAAPDQPGYWSRMTEFAVPVDREDEGIALCRDVVLPEVQMYPGVNTLVLLVDRATGHSVLTVTYRTRDDLVASRERADQLRAATVQRLGASEPIVRELEVVIVGIRPPAELPGQRQPAETAAQAARPRA